MIKPRLTVHGRLFQARIWREYARAWDGHPTTTGVGREWVEKILKVSREECLRRARLNLYLARRARRPRPAYQIPVGFRTVIDEIMLSARMSGMVIYTSTRPSSDGWIRDLWNSRRVILTEAPTPSAAEVLGVPQRIIDAIVSVERDGEIPAGTIMVIDDDEVAVDRETVARLRAAKQAVSDMTYPDGMNLDRRTIDMLALEQAISPGRLQAHDLAVFEPEPTGPRYGPYDADPHTKGRRRRFRPQRRT